LSPLNLPADKTDTKIEDEDENEDEDEVHGVPGLKKK